MIRDGREALLVLSQRQEQVGYAVGRRQLRVRHAHAEAVHAPAARRDEQRAALADQPGAERAALEREAGVALQAALVMAEQVAEEALRNLLAGAVPAPLRAAPPIAPRNAYSSGMIQAWASAANATGAASGSSHTMPMAAAMNGTV